MKIRIDVLESVLKEAIEEGCGCGGDEAAEAASMVVRKSEPKIMGHGGSAKMARSHLYHIASRAQSLHDRMDDEDQLPEWAQSKLAVAEAMVNAVYDHLDYKMRVIALDQEH